jgi:hypothetical protein
MSNESEAIKLGLAAWEDIASDGSWNRWVQIGQALEIGRAECMRLTHSNGKGRPFNEEFSRWLKANQFSGRADGKNIDGGTRSRLAECMKYLPAITEWRQRLQKLGTNEHLKYNHPNAVYRKWKASVNAEIDKADKPESGKSRSEVRKAEMLRLEEENARMRANGGDLFSPKDSAKDIAKVLFETLGESKLKTVVEKVLELMVIEQRMTAEQTAQLRMDVRKRVLLDA